MKKLARDIKAGDRLAFARSTTSVVRVVRTLHQPWHKACHLVLDNGYTIICPKDREFTTLQVEVEHG